LALARLGDFVDLSKPRIVVMVLCAVAVAAVDAGAQPWAVLHAVLGTALVAISAGAMNHYLERDLDARMERTRNRPLPAGRLAGHEAILFSLAALLAGAAHLLATHGAVCASLALLTWLIYTAVYTPLKRTTSANTWVGAVSGATPVLVGGFAAGTTPGLALASLFLVLFLWQFPHFMAIAWLHRHDYARAGMKMLTVVDSTGIRAGALAVVAALLLIPVSLVPALMPTATNVWIYVTWSLVLGLAQLGCSIGFLMLRSERSARWLLRMSLVYLPSLLLLTMWIRPV
jgi:protoheme IX farnesyltransferase